MKTDANLLSRALITIMIENEFKKYFSASVEKKIHVIYLHTVCACFARIIGYARHEKHEIEKIVSRCVSAQNVRYHLTHRNMPNMKIYTNTHSSCEGLDTDTDIHSNIPGFVYEMHREKIKRRY